MRRKVLHLSFFLGISLAFQIFISELWQKWFHKEKPNVFESVNGEHFYPPFSRLKSISDFTTYCDSVYGSKAINLSDSEQYAAIISQTLRERFYHGYSYYQLGQNSLGYLLAPLLDKGLRAIVIPDDILKHPMAACSQQSIVGMEVFKRKGFKVRKVGFFAEGIGGHFCFEAFFNGGWHFFDPDLEPKLRIMMASHFPGIAELVKNDTLLHKLYYRADGNLIKELLVTYSYGPVNKFPARNARIYQYVTKYLSYSLWLWIILLYLVVQKKFMYAKKSEDTKFQSSTVAEVRA